MIVPNHANVEIGRMRMEEMRLRAERHRLIRQGKARTKKAKAARRQRVDSDLSERIATAAAEVRTINLHLSASAIREDPLNEEPVTIADVEEPVA